jgi:hypothetical protein
MTPTERLARDIQAVRKSYRHALADALKTRLDNGSVKHVREVQGLMGSLATEIQIFMPQPANSNEVEP